MSSLQGSTSLPQTESVDAATAGLDRLDTDALVASLIESQRAAFGAVLEQRESISLAVDEIARRLERGGHLHYVGAGTSGRLAVLDAAEIPPTFGTTSELVRAHIAGGDEALLRAVEGAEDDASAGEALAERIARDDAVIGISASGGAPFVVAALETARRSGVFTVAIVNSEPSRLAEAADCTIVLRTGAEAIAGSTRLRAGTAQKIALNTISSAVMVRLGKVYDNLMVDLVATNRKLRRRAIRLVMQLASVGERRADRLLNESGGSVKCAIAMAWRNVDAAQARALLDRHGGRLRDLL
jgi:N-acetylmuramic acid 6-phosphate etherase